MKDLKSQNMLQLTRIDDLEKQLRYQEQHSSNLERLISKSEENSKANGTRRSERTQEFVYEAARNIGKVLK